LFFNSSGSLRGGKRDLYEGGVRVPMIVKWSHVVKAGTVANQPSAFWDVMPTLAEVAQVKTTSKIDGVSFLPTLKGKIQSKRNQPFYWEFYELGGKQAILRGDWKLIKFNVKTPKKSYFELYNIKNDLSEKNNLAASQPALVKELSKLLDKQYEVSDKFKW